MKLQKLDDLLLNLVVVFEARRIKGVTGKVGLKSCMHFSASLTHAEMILQKVAHEGNNLYDLHCS